MNTTTWKNRALSVVLTVIMVFSMLPLSVFAAEDPVAEVTVGSTITQYTDIDAAFKAAEKANSATIKLLADVVEIDKVNGEGVELMSGDTTLDLNGKTLKQAAEAKWPGSGITVSVGSSSYSGTVGKLTICDSVGGGKIQQINTIPAVMAWGSGTLVIEGGTIEAPDSGEWPDSGQNMYLNSAVNIDDNATVIINGGTLKGVRGVVEDLSDGGGSLTINGGTFTGTSGNALIVCNGKATLSGGTFSNDSAQNEHSIWVMNGKAADLLAENYQYIAGDGTASAYSSDGKGVVGDTVVKNPNDKSVNYINGKGELSTQADYTEITAETWDISQGWYVVKEDLTISQLNISEEANLILCDGATLTVTEYLNVGQDSTLNLYWQSGGSGKLTAKAVSPDSTITAPAGEMKQTADASGTTFEKCLVHEYEYTQNSDDTHTATCKLCGKVEDAESHRYENWTSADEKTHTGTCVCGTESMVDHEFVYHLSADKKSHYGECGVCNYTSAEELHDANGENGSCSVCGADKDIAVEKVEVTITAPGGTVTTTNYTDLLEAFKAADEGRATKVEVRLLQSDKTYTLDSEKAYPIKFEYTNGVEVIVDLNGCTLQRTVTGSTYGILQVDKGNVTFQNGTLDLDDSASAARAIKLSETGNKPTLTLENMTVKAAQGIAIYAEDGKLNIESGTYGEVQIHSAEVKLSGGSYTEVEHLFKRYADLLAPGYIFAKQSDNSYIDPATMNSDADADANIKNIKVIECTHKDGDTSLFENGICKQCGFVCTHTGGTAGYFQKAKCAVCGAEYGELATDTTAPTGRITVTERNWFETFLNTITFDLFFKEELTGKITATDDSYTQAGYVASEHAVKVEYLVADKGLTEAELTGWVAYDTGKGIDLTGERNYVVYAKLTDHAGNETLLSTDGLVIDKTAPSIGDFTDGQEVHICSDRYTVSVEDANLKEVTVDGVKQTGNSVTFRMAEFNNTHTVVAEDKAGNTSTVTFTLHGGHSYNIETGVCENGCGAAAEVRLTDGTGSRVWGTYDDARIEITRSNTPVTLTLLKDCGDYGGIPTQYCKDGLDLTIDLNGHNFGNASDQLCVLSQTADGSAKLNLIGEGSFKTEVWLCRGAALTVGENVTYVGGIKIWYDSSFGDKITGLSASLKGGKYGEIDLTYRDKNGDTQSIGTLGDLLVPGYVFSSANNDETSATNVEVMPCPGHIWNNGACERCKLICTHNWVDSTCTVCGYECLHSSVEERDGNTYCTEKCGAQMAVKVEYIDVNGTQQTKYYARADYTLNGVDYENTLQVLFNDDTITPTGSTVTLLTDGLQAWAHVQNGKTITLNLNGKKLVETGNGICTYNDDPSNKLIVTGTGRSDKNESVGFSRVFAVYGGTLEFDSGFGGKFNEIYAADGTLTFAEGQSAEINVLTIAGDVTVTPLKSGKFGKIVTEGSVTRTASSLLERRYAFQKTDGSYVPYHTEITATSALEDVTVVKCDHGMTEMPEGSGIYGDLKCPDCNEWLDAVLTTADGKINGYEELTGAYGKTTALSVAEKTPNCTVTMFCNADGLSILSTSEGFTLDANDRTIGQLTLHSGTLTVKNATITGDEHTDDPTVMTFYDSTVATLTLEDCLVEKQKEGYQATLTANGPVTLKNTTVEGTTKVYSDKEQGLTVEGSSALVGDTEVHGNLTFKSGNAAKITVYGAAEISGGTINELDASGAGRLTISGGTFGEITAPNDGRMLIDCLKDGYAFYRRDDDDSVLDSRAETLVWVKVGEHTHGDYKWDPATHEKVCACGHVTDTDTTAPTISGIADGETYYQNTLTFTAEDTGSGLAIVKDGGKALIRNASGEYTINADNKAHTITATDNAGNTATVTITVYRVYKITLPSGTGYTVDGPNTVNHGEEYVFTVRLNDGYSRVPGRYKVTAGGFELTSMSGDNDHDQYWLPSVTGDLTITVEGIADITAPDAEITIGTNSFNSFLNRITFGLFFKKTQTVTVTADDAGSGVKTVEYLLSDTAFNKPEDIIGSWNEINFSDGKATFDIDPNAKAFIYVRVTDKDGNAAYINSDGVVIYTDSTADIERISFTRLSDEDVSFKVNLNGNWFDRLLINDGKTTGSINGIISSDGTVTLKNEELRKLAVGEYTVTVKYRPLGENYVEAEGNEAPASTTVKLTVVRAARMPEFSAPDAVYDGAAYDDLTIPDKPDGTVIQYKTQGADDSTYTTDAPKNAGSYTVRISTPQDENYNAAVFTTAFTISPKKVTINGVTADSKAYDGNTEAAVSGTATPSDNYDGENLTVDTSNAKAVFDSKNVGISKTVTFSGFALGGSAAGNYELAAQPEPAMANIIPKNLTVENLKVKDKVYDGTDKAELDGTPTLKGVEDGDEVQLDCGSPTFATTDVGENIAINFTLFFLSGTDSGNYTLTQPTGITGNIAAWIADGSEYGVNSNDWINTDFIVTAKIGYLLSLTDTANGTWTDTLTASEEAADGKLTFYVKNTVTGAISAAVTEHYKIDKTAPTGTVKLDERTPFEEFLHKITFGLFFKDDVTVKLTASDEASGVKSREYYKTDKALTLAEVKALADSDWTAADSFGITAEDMAQFVIYARITDNAGNITYLSSDGAEFDTTVPEIIGVENGETYYVTQRVAFDDANLESVTVNGKSVDKDAPFDLVGDKNAVYKIVATDQAGNVTEYTVTMKPISDITDAIKDITEENVTSADADTIDKVARQILDIAAGSDEEVIGEEQWNKLTDAAASCKKLQTRIANVAAESERLTDEVTSCEIDKVTSADIADIEPLITDIDALLGGNNLTDAERAELEALKQTAQALLDRIADAKDAAESDEILAVEDITKDNVNLGDKDALEKAEKALKKALDDFDGNYTEKERKSLNDRLDAVKEALDAIGSAEKAAEEIKKLPSSDDVKLTDKDEIERISKIIDDLTDNEKALIGEDALGKLKALNEKLTELADNAKKPTSPSTGDTSNLALWIALLFISGGVITGATVAGKKKKQQDR